MNLNLMAYYLLGLRFGAPIRIFSFFKPYYYLSFGSGIHIHYGWTTCLEMNHPPVVDSNSKSIHKCSQYPFWTLWVAGPAANRLTGASKFCTASTAIPDRAGLMQSTLLTQGWLVWLSQHENNISEQARRSLLIQRYWEQATNSARHTSWIKLIRLHN